MKGLSSPTAAQTAFGQGSAVDASASASTSTTVPMPPELEQTLTMLSSHRSVLGYILLTRSHPITIIRHSGVVFEGEQGRKYASAVGRIVESVQRGLEEVSADPSDPVRLFRRDVCFPAHGPFACPTSMLTNDRLPDFCRRRQDDMRFMRIRTKRHEIMISPGTSRARRARPRDRTSRV